ncbi:MAG: PT domain-containing protein [Clostridia bacterium]|nr:PT domain-containing protein [Clostridia bacterium]
MKKIFAFLLTLALCMTCIGAAFAEEAGTGAEAESAALPDFYKTCMDDYTAINCVGSPETENGVKYLHIVGDEGTDDAYLFPENGWGPTLDHPVLLLKYRSAGGVGQFFFTTAAIGAGQPGTYTDQEFPASGTEWQYLVYDFSQNGFACFDEEAQKVVFFRIDLNAIEWMDYSYVAFFKTADEANAFAEDEKAGKVTLFDETKIVPVKYVVSPRGSDPQNFVNHYSSAIEFTVPEGKSFFGYVLSAAPTWNAQENSNLEATIYAWNRDYDTTVEGTPLGTFREEQHVDNINIVMDFGVILPPGKYVIYMVAEDDPIGAWGGTIDDVAFDAMFYFDDTENESWFPYSEILLIDGTDHAIELPTPGPTAEPTEKPTAAPTEEATEIPATDIPATDVPATDEPVSEPTANNGGEDNSGKDKSGESEGKKGLSKGAIAGIIAGAVVVVCAVVAIIVGVKKKKK